MRALQVYRLKPYTCIQHGVPPGIHSDLYGAGHLTARALSRWLRSTDNIEKPKSGQLQSLLSPTPMKSRVPVVNFATNSSGGARSLEKVDRKGCRQVVAMFSTQPCPRLHRPVNTHCAGRCDAPGRPRHALRRMRLKSGHIPVTWWGMGAGTG
ncbi:hypothetical protein Bbelb_191960 [Branchiostoma belcheri]|nr:hypothetical protein Bbelb_191960 [Branchiostoma belcheri]